ncbi:MAG: DUF423 domain-containing protein [Methylococcaceae bacterium]|nr:DUF423 domain-containing protein [Methylococcaceae bacterium]
MRSVFLFLSAVCGVVGVAVGAFGAHGLKAILSPEMLAVYKTGVDYQMWHALALGLIAVFRQQATESELLKWAGWLMFSGIVLFSGSLYLLAVFNMKWLGMITPLGGLSFILAWLLVAVFAFQSTKQN